MHSDVQAFQDFRGTSLYVEEPPSNSLDFVHTY